MSPEAHGLEMGWSKHAVKFAAAVEDVGVTVVEGRDKGTRTSVAETRAPATSIAAPTYARLLFPLPCKATPLYIND